MLSAGAFCCFDLSRAEDIVHSVGKSRVGLIQSLQCSRRTVPVMDKLTFGNSL